MKGSPSILPAIIRNTIFSQSPKIKPIALRLAREHSQIIIFLVVTNTFCVVVVTAGDYYAY